MSPVAGGLAFPTLVDFVWNGFFTFPTLVDFVWNGFLRFPRSWISSGTIFYVSHARGFHPDDFFTNPTLRILSRELFFAVRRVGFYPDDFFTKSDVADTILTTFSRNPTRRILKKPN
jgi:hypothetical protein